MKRKYKCNLIERKVDLSAIVTALVLHIRNNEVEKGKKKEV